MNELIRKLSEEFESKEKLIDELKRKNFELVAEKRKTPACPFMSAAKVQLNSVYGVFGNLESIPWRDIAAIANSGNADKILALGAVKTIALKNGDNISVRIIGFNHDQSDIALPLGITFETVETLNKDYQMNKKNTNAGGWAESYLRKMLNSDIYGEALPGDLREVIKPCAKLTFNDGELSETVDRLFVLSEQEVFGRKIYSNGGEGKWYEYYRRENTEYGKVKQNGERDWRWERSPYASSAAGFCGVGGGGGANGSTASAANGVAFGFCI